MIRGTATTIAHAITSIFNRSLLESRVPERWKISNITPIPKAGDLSSPLNYRPISILPLISKALERIVHARISKHLYSNQLLPNCQFGFRPQSSTQEALLSVTHQWHELLTTHKHVSAVFFDIKKAFDSVPHALINSSLQKAGISGSLLLWTQDYLSSRQQRVVLDGTASELASVTSGVPQGSILGPLFFNIFMDSIAKVPLSTNAKLILYADDILLFKPTSTTEDANHLQDDVNSILDWMKSHGLSPNLSKTRLLPITRFHRTQPVNLTIEDHPIALCTSFRYLGVTLTSNLKWSTHIDITCKKVKRQLGMIHRQFHQSPPNIRNQIYRSSVLPRLDYCGAVWDPHHHTDIQKLEKVKNLPAKS